MDVENLPELQPRNFGNLVDRHKPVLSILWQAEGEHRVTAHSHPRAQIIYTLSGAYWVTTPRGNWVVPRRQAVWIPCNLHHSVYTSASVTAQIFFIDIEFCEKLLPDCSVMRVTPLLHELFSRVVECGNGYAPDGPEARLVNVMLDELAAMEPAPLHLPLSSDRRLNTVMASLLDNPADNRSLDEIASSCGASARTLSRLFSESTGMTFGKWRTQLRLQEALDRLGQGQSVTRVATDLGYRSTSAFCAMFRRTLGTSPGDFLSK